MQKAMPIDRSQIREAARAAAEKPLNIGVSIVFVDDKTIRQVNEEFLGHDNATDVIAFDYRDSEGETPFEEENAEIVISVERAIREAKRRRQPIARELLLYVIHGVLHLTGYDDLQKDAARIMRKQQLRVLNSISHLWKESETKQ